MFIYLLQNKARYLGVFLIGNVLVVSVTMDLQTGHLEDIPCVDFFDYYLLWTFSMAAALNIKWTNAVKMVEK